MSASPLALPLPRLQSTRWLHALGALALAQAGLLLLYRESAWGMVRVWSRSDTFAHGFLVLPLVLWLVWRQRPQLSAQLPQAAPQWLFAVPLLGLLWLLGDLASVQALTQWCVVALLVLSVVVVLGTAVAHTLLFALAFAFFAVPMGEFLLPQLMEWTADVTIFALRLSGIPVYREGLNFVIPSGRWSVVEACSGVRYLIASFMVGTLFAYLNYQSNRRRALFMAVALLVPVLANWLRAYLIVLLGHLSDNRIATGVDHLLYGWLFFGVVIGLMFMVGARWSEPPVPVAAVSGAAVGAGSTAAPSAAPSASGAPQPFWAAALALGALAALPHLAVAWLERSEAPPSVAHAAQAGPVQPHPLLQPLVLGAQWPPGDAAALAFRPAYQQPGAELHAAYGPPGRVVGMYVGLTRPAAAGVVLADGRAGGRSLSLVRSDNVLVQSTDPQWVVASRGNASAPVGAQRVQLRSTTVRSANLHHPTDGRAWVVWQVYWVHGQLTASDYEAKAWSAYYRLLGRRDDTAVLVVYAPQGERLPGAAHASAPGEAALAAFLADNYGAIHAWLQREFAAHNTVQEGSS